MHMQRTLQSYEVAIFVPLRVHVHSVPCAQPRALIPRVGRQQFAIAPRLISLNCILSFCHALCQGVCSAYAIIGKAKALIFLIGYVV